MRRPLLWLGLILWAPPASHAANLTAQGVSVLDSGGNARASFSNSEALTLRFQVNNSAAGPAIDFKFHVTDPGGTERLLHEGNQAPGTPGLAQTQISGVAIARFYTTPGSYIFRGEAVQGAETVSQSAQFVVASPNITLIYPPNGATGLLDSPLIFRWIGSGASQYRFTVSRNAGLYPVVYQTINSGETFYSYPLDTGNPLEQLVPQQIYYWKIEGLDAAGNTISESGVNNFTLGAQASSQSRNVMVTSLELSAPLQGPDQPVNFKAVVQNAGSSAESNIGLKFSLGGINGQDSPKQIVLLAAGEQKETPFTAFMPSDQESSLAVACVDIFDDNLTDNCKTRLISRGSGDAASGGAGGKLSYDELWAELLKKLGPDALKALEGYTFETIECPGCSGSELSDFLNALITGDASLAGASIAETGAVSADASSQTGERSDSETAADAGDSTEVDLSVLQPSSRGQTEWSGYTTAFSDRSDSTFVITDKKAWKKLWQSVSESELPEVDFGKKMVLGIVSAARDRAETVRILSKRRTEEGVTVDYYCIQAAKGKEIPAAAYMFKAVDREIGKVGFRRLDVGGGAKR